MVHVFRVELWKLETGCGHAQSKLDQYPLFFPTQDMFIFILEDTSWTATVAAVICEL